MEQLKQKACALNFTEEFGIPSETATFVPKIETRACPHCRTMTPLPLRWTHRSHEDDMNAWALSLSEKAALFATICQKSPSKFTVLQNFKFSFKNLYKILSAKNAHELPRTRELFPVLLLPKTRHVFLLFLKLCSSKELPGELKKIVRLPPEAVSGVDAGLHMTPCLFETQHQRARCTHAMPFRAREKLN